jgi:hypothetical protein
MEHVLALLYVSLHRALSWWTLVDKPLFQELLF